VSDSPVWQPREGLVVDVRHALAHAPRTTAQDRFEAWAWRALLDEDGPALLTRHAAPSHLTASAIVMSPDATRTCLVLHGKIRQWVQPGGHLEPDDASVLLAAAREAEEETGVTGEVLADPVLLSRHTAPCRPGVVDWHLDVQFALVADTTSTRVSSESLDVAWFDVAALPDDLAPGVRESVDRAVAAVAAVTALGGAGQWKSVPSELSSSEVSRSSEVSTPSASSPPMVRSRAAANPSR
jgi:8-oxo-dGTP pyrophosphatase MutT (NUDIX family)